MNWPVSKVKKQQEQEFAQKLFGLKMVKRTPPSLLI
jgi:hypothetical protein